MLDINLEVNKRYFLFHTFTWLSILFADSCCLEKKVLTYKSTQNDLRTHVRTIHELEIEDTTNSKTEEDEDIAKPSKRIRLEVEDDFMESSNQEIQNDCFELQPNPFGFTGNSSEINDPLQTIVEPKNILNDHQDDDFKANTNELLAPFSNF